jgi:hypothetical protein
MLHRRIKASLVVTATLIVKADVQAKLALEISLIGFNTTAR